MEVIHSISRSLKLFCDNSVVVSFSKNTRSTSLSKNIDVKFFFVKEKVAESLISVEHTPITSILADPLTKGLPIFVFQEHVTCMGLLETSTLCFSGSFVFSLLHARFDICYYLMILYHFDQMNDRIIFFFVLINALVIVMLLD